MGTWRALLVVLVLLVGPALSKARPPQCPNGAVLHGLQQPAYEHGARPEGGFMAPFVQSFLNTVQPKLFPKDLLLKILADPWNIWTNGQFIRNLLWYEVGFLVCAAIGVLYIVLMPIVGLILACCRCCGNCGGKMRQKQTSSIHCRRRALYWSTFVTTVIILAGNVCMFRSNEILRVSLGNGMAELNRAMNNVSIYLTAVPQQVQHVVDESYVTIDKVSNNLDAIGPLLGRAIQKDFEPTFTAAVRGLVATNEVAVNTSTHLDNLNTSLAGLESAGSKVQDDFEKLKIKIMTTLSRPGCGNCAGVRPKLNDLTVDTSINTPVLNELQTELKGVREADLSSKVKQMEGEFNDIPMTVTNDTRKVVQSSKMQLEEIKIQISAVILGLPVFVVDDVKMELQRVQRQINSIKPELDRVEYIRWCVCVTVCCVVLLLVLCNVFGLVLGPLGLKLNVDPTKRSRTSDCGGTFFMIGAGLSFVFSWLFMILVILGFLALGNTYTLLCKTWNNRELLKLLETPGLSPFDLSNTLGKNVTLSGIYSDCEANKSAWFTLQLHRLINLDDLFSVSQYTDEIRKKFESTDIELTPVTFLTAGVKGRLESLASRANAVDFTTLVQQINNISRINLNDTAGSLLQVALMNGGQTRQELLNHALSLLEIQAELEKTVVPEMTTVNSTLDELKTTVERVNAMVGEVLQRAGEAQDFFNKNAAQIVKNESRYFLDCQLGFLTTFANWAKMTIMHEMGRCGPVAGAVDSAEITVCSNAVEALNAFWFSLGWCLIFLIPSIILSIKLAKHYRRMKYSDVLDNHIDMNFIPRAQMKIS